MFHCFIETDNIQTDTFFVLIQVHPPGTMPLQENLMFVRSGEQVVFTMRNVSIERQLGSGCISYDILPATQKLKHYDSFADVYGTIYGVETCQKTCEQRRAMIKCNCLLEGGTKVL